MLKMGTIMIFMWISEVKRRWLIVDELMRDG